MNLLRALFALCLLASWILPAAAEAAPPEYETVGGYFFGEASGQDGTGFNISDADDLGFHAVQDIYRIRDVHATILHLMGLSDMRLTYYHAGRNRRLTDTGGNRIAQILS